MKSHENYAGILEAVKRDSSAAIKSMKLRLASELLEVINTTQFNNDKLETFKLEEKALSLVEDLFIDVLNKLEGERI
jgi:hypothetical protein